MCTEIKKCFTKEQREKNPKERIQNMNKNQALFEMFRFVFLPFLHCLLPEKLYGTHVYCTVKYLVLHQNSKTTTKIYRESLSRCHFHSTWEDRLDFIFALAQVVWYIQTELFNGNILDIFLAVAWHRWFIASSLNVNHNNKKEKINKLLPAKRKKNIPEKKQQQQMRGWSNV